MLFVTAVLAPADVAQQKGVVRFVKEGRHSSYTLHGIGAIGVVWAGVIATGWCGGFVARGRRPVAGTSRGCDSYRGLPRC